MTDEKIDYDALAARLTDASVSAPEPADAVVGESAAARGRELLLREYGTESGIEDAMRRGRPSVGSAKSGASPVVRGAIPVVEYEALRSLMETSGMREAQLVRRAIHELLVAEKLVS